MQKKFSDYASKFKGKSVPYGIVLLAFAAIFICFAMWRHGRGSAAENAGNASAGSASAGNVPTAGKETVTAEKKSGNTALENTSAGDGTTAAGETPEETENIPAVSSPYENIAISVAERYVKIYQKPDTSGKVLGKLYGGSSAKILKLDGEWVKLKSGRLTGYAKTDYLAIGAAAESAAEVSGQYIATVKKKKGVACVHTDADKKSAVLKKVKSGSRWKVTGENGDWTEIRIGGKTGYIASTQIRMGLQFEKAISIGEEKRQRARAKRLKREAALIAERQRESLSSANLYAGGTSAGSALQKSIVSYALQFVGNPYVWGGVSLTNGCDCSGFVMKIYEKYGYRLPHYSASQAGCGRSVSLTALEPGDLVFYRHGGRIGHVAMYIGNGRIVHAKSKKDGIVVTDVNYAAPYCAVRLV